MLESIPKSGASLISAYLGEFLGQLVFVVIQVLRINGGPLKQLSKECNVLGII